MDATTSHSEIDSYAQTKHVHRRWFIGPILDSAISVQTVATSSRKQSGWRGTDNHENVDSDDLFPQAIKDRALEFFLRSGGNEAEWGEKAQEQVVEEMKSRWKNTEWGRIIRGKRRRQKSAGNELWVGNSFEVGSFLGINILEESDNAKARSPTPKPYDMSVVSHLVRQSLPTRDTFVTAPEEPGESPLENVARAKLDSVLTLQTSSNLSTTALLRPPLIEALPSSARTEPIPKTNLTAGVSVAAKSDSAVPGLRNDKGKAKQVRIAEVVTKDSPAPPQEVLKRSGDAIEATSAGASIIATKPPSDRKSDIFMQDRMLVRACSTKANLLGISFDEAQHRTTRHLEHEDCAEFLVIWRKNSDGEKWIELYEDYSLPFKEQLLKHKYLAFVIPLTASACQLSLYSFVDHTFSITCQPTSTEKRGDRIRHLSKRAKEGTNIFIFKIKSRTRALDWVWHVWLEIGGQIPPNLEVRSVSLDSRLNVDISAELNGTLTCERVKELCIKVLEKVPEWSTLIGKEMSVGRGLQLAWRLGTVLDWIWLEQDAEGKGRDGAILVGSALKQMGNHCHLELRKAEYSPSSVVENGIKVFQPPSIEGYLDLIKPVTQAKQPVYLSTHEGLIFVLPRSQAHPPLPPGADLTGTHKKADEVKRGTLQVAEAFGICDVKNILAVRRAFQLVPNHFAQPPEGKGREKDFDEWANTWVSEEGQAIEQGLTAENEDEDEGGEGGMLKAADKGGLKTRRSFELLFKSGHVFRFEAYSRRVALEWIDRLKVIVQYWRQRYKVDAREEMDLAQLGSNRPRVTPRIHPYEDPDAVTEPLIEPHANFPALGAIYNWCVLDGCKCIIKKGKLFTRRGLRGQYKLVELILTAGYLIQYHITQKSLLHHRQSKSIGLSDAYVCSGYLAALVLPKDEFDVNAPPVARRYQDGLEVDDSDEDTLFVILHRQQKLSMDAQNQSSTSASTKLRVKRKLAVFRTRSKLERDAWCWAINCEIEKLARVTKVT